MNKNRMISVLLAFIIAVPLFAPAIAADETAGAYETEIKIMTALGFMKKMNTEDENAAVTKGMFTAAVLELMGYSMYGLSDSSPFRDVTDSTAYRDEICAAAAYGFIHGDEAHNFEPDSLISYTNALVILENAMGYHTAAAYNGGYPAGYIKTAMDNGLSKGIKIGADDKLNVGMCAKLLLNAGNTEIINSGLLDESYRYRKGEKLFWDRHKIVRDTGVVTANEQTSVDSSVGTEKNGIIIGDVSGSIYFSNESTEYLGYQVEFYYRQDEEENIVLYMQPRNTNVITIESEDADGFDGKELKYYVGDRLRAKNIPKEASVIFNGVYTINYSLEDGTSIFCPECGDIKLIDNNSDGRIDVVSVTAYENLVVAAVDKEECVVYDKYEKERNLNYFSPDKVWILTDSAGNIMGFDDLKKWDVVSVAKSLNGEVLRAVVSRNKIVGTVNAVGEVNGRKQLTVEKGKYFVARSYPKSQQIPKLGEQTTFYLDYHGNIAAVENTGTDANYGFLIQLGHKSEFDNCLAQMMDAEGVVSTIPFAEKVTIDGDERLSGNTLLKRLGFMSAGDGVELPSTVKEYSLVVYKTNGKGEIIYLDTAYKGPNEDENTLHRINNYDGTYLWFRTSQLFGVGRNSVYIDPSTLQFKTPAKEFANDIKDYGMSTFADLVYGTQYTVHAYSTNSESIVPEAIHLPMKSEDGGSMPRNARTCLIKDISRTLNDEEEQTWIIDYYSGTAEYSTYVAADVDVSKYEIGDIIKVTINGRGEISYINHVYDADAGGFAADNQYGTGADFGNEYQPYAAKLFILDNEVVGIADTVGPDTSFADCTFQRITDADTAVYVVRPGKNGRTIARISAGDLPTVMDYYHNGVETPLYLMTTYGVAKVLVIYKLND